MVDLTGQVFGELTVVEYVGKNQHHHDVWRCRCSCGAQKEVASGNLRSGKTNSCGHLKRKKSEAFIGQVFGNTEILSLSQKASHGNGLYVYCHCLLCGKKFETSLQSLKKGFMQSCGCSKRDNILGKRFGKVVVIESLGKDSIGHYTWKCRCDCGNEFSATTSNLNSGKIKTCGCRKLDAAQRKVGEVFGNAKVLEIIDRKTKDGGTIARCLCLLCGKEFRIQTHTLTRGYETSCGCHRNELFDRAREKLQTPEGRQQAGIYAGTKLPNIMSSKLSKSNTSGIKGVYVKKGKFIACIGFQGKSYYLGSYDNLSEAAQARKFAEDKLVSPLFEQYLTEAEHKGTWIKQFIASFENGGDSEL